MGGRGSTIVSASVALIAEEEEPAKEASAALVLQAMFPALTVFCESGRLGDDIPLHIPHHPPSHHTHYETLSPPPL